MLLSKELLHTTDSHIKKLKSAGIETAFDFLEHFPRAIENRSSAIESFAYVHLKEKNTLKVQIESIISERTRSGKTLTKVILLDRNDSRAEAIYFSKPYFLQKFQSGDRVMVFGKAKYEYGKLSFPSPEIEHATDQFAQFVPVYSDCNYIPGSWFADKMKYVRSFLSEIEERLPSEIRAKKKFRARARNIEALHFPESIADFERARSEFQQNATEGKAPRIPLNPESMKELIAMLPYQLTSKQKIVLFQILRDMEKPHSMSRLLQGDV
jgi:ATP-dependent DNA helicase RecG